MSFQVVSGRVWHKRLKPIEHSFTYPHIMLELYPFSEPEGGGSFPFRELLGVYKVLSRDYLSPTTDSISDKLQLLFESRNLTVNRVILFTVPRLFGYVFNPVSFYLLFGSGKDELVGVIAEVNNTFDEKHLYVLGEEEIISSPRLRLGSNEVSSSFSFPKAFYVSPFFNVEGEYLLHVSLSSSSFRLEVELLNDDTRVFSAGVSGERAQGSSARLFLSLPRFIFSAWMPLTLIVRQAALLYFRRGVNLICKPLESDPSTVQRRPRTFFGALRLGVVNFLARNASRGGGNRIIAEGTKGTKECRK